MSGSVLRTREGSGWRRLPTRYAFPGSSSGKLSPTPPGPPLAPFTMPVSRKVTVRVLLGTIRRHLATSGYRSPPLRAYGGTVRASLFWSSIAVEWQRDALGPSFIPGQSDFGPSSSRCYPPTWALPATPAPAWRRLASILGIERYATATTFSFQKFELEQRNALLDSTPGAKT
ncbi:hypothetical protein BDP81DRAFT_218383 [Colletotrichum phormii]|uniref:Uncharacterized protein n=1 Tax=Colletotrichum phormii TaxID=359342 RepID=A0AAI9ZRX2_9PEZI|nr:uncharacterized protein BDP81DRAFT_218383 [Colletotrichum phormii]KAK1637085.1 hypothetical protein BDP81DRAFT_218383 [Colletotrichum phormii]